jgi:hypothetical protein
MRPLRVIGPVLVGAATLAAVESDIDTAIRGVLTRYLRFTTSELADLQAGKVVRHGLDSTAAGEVGVVGAVRIRAPKAKFLTHVRDIARFKSGPDVLQIGEFSRPPTHRRSRRPDRRGERLRRPGVPGWQLRRTAARGGDSACRAGGRSGAPDVQQRAAARFKQVLLDDVTAYVIGSPGRFEQYDEGARPIRPLDEFDGVLRSSPALDALVPGLSDHLKNFPSSRLPDAKTFSIGRKRRSACRRSSP